MVQTKYKNLKLKIIVIPLLLFFEGVIFADNAFKTTKSIAELSEAIKLLDDSKNEAKSLRTLNRLIKNNDQNISCLARASLSRFYRNNNKVDKAWEVVKDCSDFDRLVKVRTSKEETNGYTEAFLEAAHCEATMKNTREAFKMLDYAESRTEGFDKVCSMKKYAEVLMMIEEPEKAGAYLRNALEYGRKYLVADKEKRSPGDTDVGRNNEAWLKLENEIEKMIFDVEIMLYTKEYGSGYALYVKMRTLLDQKLFENAKITCEEIIGNNPNSIYGEAAKLFHAYCQVETKNYKEAEKELLTFISEKPYGLYRGDAWMRLGRIELEDNWDSKKSSEYYKKALEWFRYMREKKDLIDIYTVPDRVKTISTPGGNATYLDEWYSTKFRKIDPREIINHETAQWYMDENEKECLFLVGFFLFMEGNFPEAKNCFLKVKSVSKDLSMLEASKIPNTLMRLRGACDQGWLQAPPEHMNKFKGKYRLKLFLADLYWTVEKYSDAEQLYEDVINDGKAGDEEKAYAMIGKARCWSSMVKSDKETRISMFRAVLDKYPKTMSAPLALYYLGCMEDSRGSLKAIEYYRECYEKYPDTPTAECCMARCIQSADGKEDKLAWEYAQKYFKAYHEGKYSAAIKQTISHSNYDIFRR